MSHGNSHITASRAALLLAASLFTLTLTAQVTDDALLQAFQWRNIGPANMGGRVVDIEAVDDDFKVVYLASASGGVWKSLNAGTTWEPIFDDYPSASIGDVAVLQSNPAIVWVGTGEANNCTITSVSQSSITRDIIWVGTDDGNVQVTRDGGVSWTNVRPNIRGVPEGIWLGRLEASHHEPGTAYVTFDGHRSDVFTP
jgi:photosystem II stability/assembly factor-like uncharacterized protein